MGVGLTGKGEMDLNKGRGNGPKQREGVTGPRHKVVTAG